jgi:hypothetical protein
MMRTSSRQDLFERVPLRCDVDGEGDCNQRADDYRKNLEKGIERIEAGRDQGQASKYDSDEARQRERSRSLRHRQEKKSADGIESADTGRAVGSEAVIGGGDETQKLCVKPATTSAEPNRTMSSIGL